MEHWLSNVYNVHRTSPTHLPCFNFLLASTPSTFIYNSDGSVSFSGGGRPFEVYKSIYDWPLTFL